MESARQEQQKREQEVQAAVESARREIEAMEHKRRRRAHTGRADAKGHHVDPVGVDPHNRGALAVLRRGPDRLAQVRPLQDIHEDRRHRERAQKRRQLLLQFPVQILRAANEPDRGHAKPLRRHCPLRRFNQRRMIGQTKVVIGAKVNDLPVPYRDLPALG